MERRGFLKGMVVVAGAFLSPSLGAAQKYADEIGTVRFNEQQQKLFCLYGRFGMPVYRADDDGIVREFNQ